MLNIVNTKHVIILKVLYETQLGIILHVSEDAKDQSPIMLDIKSTK